MFEIKKFVAPPVFFTDRKKVLDFEQTIKNLPKNSIIIIREYDLDKKNREEFAKKIISFARSDCMKVLVGKDFELAKKIKADGIHFSDFDKIPLEFFKKKSFSKKFIFSFSCHSEKSFLKWKSFDPNIIFIAPIFPTTSHVGTKNFGLKNLAKITFRQKKYGHFLPKIYALGGINLANITSVRKLGISGFGAIDLFLENL